MGFSCGIVGLPNVGKSTLFNALTKTAAAQAENYPFCTIEPNVGEVAVPDPRLEALARIVKPTAVVPTRLTFVDIAGLVRGAAAGEGLGNRFLARIREVDAIIHVLRCFEDSDIAHVENRVDPLADAETVETELALADLESLEKRRAALEKRIKSGGKDARHWLEVVDAALVPLREGRPARSVGVAEADAAIWRQLQLLTAKPVLYAGNTTEADATGNAQTGAVMARAASEHAGMIVIAAAMEAELAALDEADSAALLADMGLEEPGLNRLIRAGYDLLDLVTFFTAGPKEVRAWTVPRGTAARTAAGVIHTDFEQGFIRAETIAYDDFLACDGEAGARSAGRVRLEGKDYAVQDGDVLHIRFAI